MRNLRAQSFGGDVIAENDPDEQQKRLRYNDMVASSVILQNTVDMMRILQKLAREGWQFTDEDEIGRASCRERVSSPV